MIEKRRHPDPLPGWLESAHPQDGANGPEPTPATSTGCEGGGGNAAWLRDEFAAQSRRATELAAKLALAARREHELRELLLDAHDQLLRRDDELQAALAAALDRRQPPAGAVPNSARISRLDYERLVSDVRRSVEATVPESAHVAVVSRGDDDLLHFSGRHGQHFPQAADGAYAGHHPADSAAAITLVESTAAAGAQFLVFPSTSFWWLEHYAELAEHLGSRYTRLLETDACVVFALGDRPPSQTDRPGEGDYSALVSRIREVVCAEVPAEATVLVVSRGDDELLNLYGRRAWHFPRHDDGRYAGHHPSDSAAAIGHLEQLRASGATHLVFPATAYWWLDYYEGLRNHLMERHRTLFRQDDTCVVFELRPNRRRLRLSRVLSRSSPGP
jgi:hypothetical protein